MSFHHVYIVSHSGYYVKDNRLLIKYCLLRNGVSDKELCHGYEVFGFLVEFPRPGFKVSFQSPDAINDAGRHVPDFLRPFRDVALTCTEELGCVGLVESESSYEASNSSCVSTHARNIPRGIRECKEKILDSQRDIG